MMNLDTVSLYIDSINLSEWRFYLSWRANFEPDLYDHVIISDGHQANDSTETQTIRGGIS